MVAISPAVQVVTTGTDWPAIVAAISTGVVGLAGIGGTVWSGKRSINAEDARAQLARKRQLYVDCMAAFAEMISASELYEKEFPGAKQDAKSWRAAKARHEKATEAMHATLLKMRLGAPQNVSQLAISVRNKFMEYAEKVRAEESTDSVGDQVAELHHGLESAMRADLGETD